MDSLLKLLEQLVNGINTGILYGLIAIGYTMVYGVIQLINFAHGEVCMIGAMLTVSLAGLFFAPEAVYVGTIPFFCFVALAAGLDGGFGIVLDKVAYKPLRSASRLSALITAIGMSLLLQNVAVLIWGPAARVVRKPAWLDVTALRIGGRFGVQISWFHLLVLGITVICMLGLYFIVMRTRLGTAMRACAQNPAAAALMGVRRDRVVAVTFCIGSFLGAIGGVAVAINKGSFDYQIGLYVGVVAFAAAVLGGIGSIPGAMLGGLIIGVAEALAAGYLSEIPHPFTDGTINTGYKEAVGFLVLILIILFRPEGLLGRKGGDRA